MTDKIIVIVYLLTVLIIGVYYRAKGNSIKSLGVIKDSEINTKWLLIATIFTTSIGGGTIFGITEKAASDGMAWAYGLILTIPIDIAIAFIVVPKLIKYHGTISMGEIVEKNYGTSGKILTGLCATIASLGYLAAQISVSGYIFEYVFGLKHTEGLILSYLIVIIYTAAGGLKSIVATHFLQFFAMITTIPVITFFSISKLGVDQISNYIPSSQYSLLDSNLLWSSLKIALSFSVMGFYPSFIQRALINKDPQKTKSAIIIKSMFYAIFLLCVGINGIIAAYLVPEYSPSLSLLGVIDLFFSPAIKGFLVIGLLAAIISTADSNLNIASISIVNDLIKPIVHVKGRITLFLLTQIITVIIGGASIYMALKFDSILGLIIFIAGFWSPLVLSQLIFGLFDIKISITGFFVTALLGLLSFILWESYSFSDKFGIVGVFVGSFINFLTFWLYKMMSEIGRKTKNSLTF